MRLMPEEGPEAGLEAAALAAGAAGREKRESEQTESEIHKPESNTTSENNRHKSVYICHFFYLYTLKKILSLVF
jgi:hypothetical protein